MKNYCFFFLIVLAFAKLRAQDRAIDSLKQVLKHTTQDTTKVAAYLALGEAFYIRNPNSALQLWEKAHDITERNLKSGSLNERSRKQYKNYLATSFNNIGCIYIYNGDISKALDYFNKGLAILEEVDNKDGLASAFNNLAYIYKDQGDIAKALEYNLKSLAIYEVLGDKRGIAVNYQSIGHIYGDKGNIPKALEYYLKSIKTSEEIGDKVGTAYSLTSIGLIYLEQEERTQSLDYFFKALKLQKEIGDKRGMAESLNNIGTVYKQMGDTAKEKEFYVQSLEIAEDIGDKQKIAHALNNLGSVYKNAGNLSKALEYYNNALTMQEEIEDKSGTVNSLTNLSAIYADQKKFDASLEAGLKAMKLGRELGFPKSIRNIAWQLNRVYTATGNYRKALESYELYIEMRDSIDNQENKKASIRSQFKYDYDKRAAQDSIKVAEEKKVVAIRFEKERTQRFALYGGLVLVLLFAIFMFNRFRVTQKQRNIIASKEKETQHQKQIIEEKAAELSARHKEITDSINYAERIQRSFLATKELLDGNLSSPKVAGNHVRDYFILFKPKDVVSGDFYWASTLSNGTFALAVADSTGHGVPGAIMSLLNVTSLEKSAEQLSNPADMLNHTRQTIIGRLKKDGSTEGGKDGMDCSLLVFDFEKKTLEVAAANNPVWIVRKVASSQTTSTASVLGTLTEALEVSTEVIEIKPDKMPVGKSDRQHEPFTLHTVPLQTGDVIYALTDGFPDQFGGPKGKKFMSKHLKERLLEIAPLPMEQQKALLEETFRDWIGNLEQVDDVCIIGIRV